MRYLSYLPATVVIALAGCLHRSPEERILAAFAEPANQPLFFGEPAPEYIRFADPVSARVLGESVRAGKYRIAPRDEPLFCPGQPETGNHGYMLAVHVRSVTGDTALATFSEDCALSTMKCPQGESCASTGGGFVRTSTDYLLVRSGAKWRIEKALGGGVMTAM